MSFIPSPTRPIFLKILAIFIFSGIFCAQHPAQASEVGKQAQAIFVKCLERQKATSRETARQDFAVCSAGFGQLGKAIASKKFNPRDVQYMYFFNGRIAAAMHVIVMKNNGFKYDKPACDSIERAKWSFEKSKPSAGSFEEKTINKYNLAKALKRCRASFGSPNWK